MIALLGHNANDLLSQFFSFIVYAQKQKLRRNTPAVSFLLDLHSFLSYLTLPPSLSNTPLHPRHDNVPCAFVAITYVSSPTTAKVQCTSARTGPSVARHSLYVERG